MSRSGRPRGTYPVGRQRRAQIIELAKNHFARAGYGGTSTAEIARSAGITEAGLLHHFASKKILLLEVLAASEQESGQLAPEVLDGTATVAQMWSTIVRIAEHNAAVPGLIELYVMLSAEATNPTHPAHSWFTDRYRQLLEVTERILRRGVEAGEIAAGTDCAEVAREIIAIQDGLQIQWVLTGSTFDLAKSIRASIGRIAASVSAQGR